MTPEKLDEARHFDTFLNCQRLQRRLVSYTKEDLESPEHIIWWAEELSPKAKLLGVHLAKSACELTGEIFDSAHDAMYFCDINDCEQLAHLLQELTEKRVLEFGRIIDGPVFGSIFAAFAVDVDFYYGDDGNLPADWEPEEFGGDEHDYFVERECGEILLRQRDPRRARIYEKTGFRCFYCIVAPAEHLDHKIPKIRGGSNKDENLIGACARCNIQKKDRTVEEYRAHLAYKRRLPSLSYVRFYGEPAQ